MPLLHETMHKYKIQFWCRSDDTKPRYEYEVEATNDVAALAIASNKPMFTYWATSKSFYIKIQHVE